MLIIGDDADFPVEGCSYPYHTFIFFLIPGHAPELSDSVKLLLIDAKRQGFEIDQVLKSID